jgi:two-component system, sporulation sensor kinase E
LRFTGWRKLKKQIRNNEYCVKQQKVKELEESERKFRRIFEDSMDGLILWNDEYRVVDLNCAAEIMFGLSKDQIQGRILFDLFKQQKDKQVEIIQHIEQVIENGNHTSSIVFESKDGKVKHYDYSTKREIIEGVNFTVFKDMTEKAKMQEQLWKSDRLNVIGELAAGIAHEIRNPMTALKGFIQLLEGSIKKDHSMYYDVITSELARIDSIINEFLIIAKPQEIRFQEGDINQIIRETVDLLNAQAVLYNVQFKTTYDGQLPLIYCESNQLKKVFINIIKNAIEVMPEGGNITITTKEINNQRILVSIGDEGIGIPKEKINKLGEPFFTTKDQGTGLGLMVSYKIMDEHNGTIRVESEVGKGTVFHLTLPVNAKRLNYPS